jgi:asparagine synthase (glutamine-hydrolysing)
MCGVLGVVASVGRVLSIDEPSLVRMRDMMAHRGPDGEGWWMNHHIAFAHKRLSILDLEHGHQPYHLGTPGAPDHQVLSFNGEIYNHLAIRKELEAQGVRFESHCDTETLAKGWRQWGKKLLPKLRGMFAFAVYEAYCQRVTIVRDPMGIKPLYYSVVQTPMGCEVVFASEPLPILAHPHVSVQPDWTTVSSYMTTIRTTLGHRSMYDGVYVLQPGELIEVNLVSDVPEMQGSFWYQANNDSQILTLEEAIDETRSVINASVDSHLMSDVATSSLLSGGLDSTIITSRTLDHIGDLKTWCTGIISDQKKGADGLQRELTGDVEHASKVAEFFGTQHQTVPINSRQFNKLWPWMIQKTGLPLSTPNQVAIYQVAKGLSRHAKVALSGEGADEIFAGYDAQLLPFARYLNGMSDSPDAPYQSPLDFYLHMTSWVPVQLKGHVFTNPVTEQIGQDHQLIDELTQIFSGRDREGYGLAHMMMAQRKFNLTGLLERLDSSTMLASVEGRTPFADVRVSEFADQLPMDYHIAMNEDYSSAISKQLLRKAFSDRVPEHVLNRPKASFPVPFQSWMSQQGEAMLKSSVASDVFDKEAMALVAGQTSAHWATAWPMLNISLWLEAIWGAQAVRLAA